MYCFSGYLEEKGLEATRNVFAKESFDLLAGDVQTPAIEGQKLSLIVDEYFLLKGVGKFKCLPFMIHHHLKTGKLTKCTNYKHNSVRIHRAKYEREKYFL